MKYGAAVVLRLLPAWLALGRDERRAATAPLLAIASRHGGDVTVDWFDADALGTGYTDWILCRFDDLDRYHAMWEELRDTEFFSRPYAEIVQVLIGLHDGFRRYERNDL